MLFSRVRSYDEKFSNAVNHTEMTVRDDGGLTCGYVVDTLLAASESCTGWRSAIIFYSGLLDLCSSGDDVCPIDYLPLSG